jgi:hypothetical protein
MSQEGVETPVVQPPPAVVDQPSEAAVGQPPAAVDQPPSEGATGADKEALKQNLKEAFALIKSEPELKESLGEISKGPQPTTQDDGQPTAGAADNAAKIAELEAKISNESTSDEEKKTAKAELDKLKPPAPPAAAAAAGGRRRTKRKHHKKGKSAKKGGKKHRKSSGKKSRRSSSKKSRRYGRK